MSYHAQLRALHDAITHGQPAQAVSLVLPAREDAFPPHARVAVYSDGYMTRLADATMSDYPALAHYLGEARCRALALAYARDTISHHWDLNRYPVGFAAFLQAYEPDSAAHAIATLESAIAEVFWLPDSPALSPDTFAHISEDALASMHLTLRPAARLLALPYTANAYLTAQRAGGEAAITADTEYLMVIRAGYEVTRMVLEADEFAMLTCLAGSAPFGEALGALAEGDDVPQRLQHYMMRWMKWGVFMDTTIPHTEN